MINKEWTLGTNSPSLEAEGSNYQEWYTRVTIRVTLHSARNYLNTDPMDDVEKRLCLNFTVLIHENVIPVLHSHCDLDSFMTTWKNLITIEPDSAEDEEDILLHANHTILHEK